jgi:alpha 1,2-mannosyltransferase
MTSTASAALAPEAVRVFKPKTGTANAAFVVLAPNSEKDNLVASIKQLEARFNSKYNYPYVILNDDEFSQEFKDALNAATNAEVKFGFIEKPMWSYPDFIDQEKAARDREHIAQKGVPYASSESYRHMCR